MTVFENESHVFQNRHLSVYALLVLTWIVIYMQLPHLGLDNSVNLNLAAAVLLV